jgi:hypothetical protein
MECPFCERNLKVRDNSGPVTCDGCEGRFNPGKLRYQPASLARQVAGWVLIIIGGSNLLWIIGVVLVTVSIETAKPPGSRDWEIPLLLTMTCFVPSLLLAVGLALTRGRMVIDAPPDEIAPYLDV